ncbi:MAG TPA: SgcJ/EcaC family oxidoreductase [Acidobacteriota bacterium]|nr:SgcJ/EcaC family oxidoreductase [Acidobacteriota bacterium]
MMRTSLWRLFFRVGFVLALTAPLGAGVAVQDQEHLILEPGVEKLAGLDAVYQRFTRAYRELDADLFNQIYAQDALYLSPNQPIRKGYDEFVGGFRGMFEGAGQRGQALDISFRIVDRQISGGLATDVGIYTLIRREDGEIVHRSRGKFVVVARRQEDGNWLFHVDGYSGMPDDE